MRPEEEIDQAIQTFRTTKTSQFEMAAKDHPQRLLNLREVAGIVDDALEELRQILTEDLEREVSERERWWGEPEPGPYEHSRGQLTDEGYLPRTLPGSSWWTRDPE